MLLLEYAPLGNLDAVLNSRRGLSRGMQHRIALQVCMTVAMVVIGYSVNLVAHSTLVVRENESSVGNQQKFLSAKVCSVCRR